MKYTISLYLLLISFTSTIIGAGMRIPEGDAISYILRYADNTTEMITRFSRNHYSGIFYAHGSDIAYTYPACQAKKVFQGLEKLHTQQTAVTPTSTTSPTSSSSSCTSSAPKREWKSPLLGAGKQIAQ